MLYEETTIYQLAGALGLALSAAIVLFVAIFGGPLGGLRKAYFAVAAAAFLVTVSTAVWGLTTFHSTNDAADTEAAAYFGEYGLNITGEEAEQIRDRRAEGHTMYFDVDGATEEILFRSVDGAVVPFTANGHGSWVRMETAG